MPELALNDDLCRAESFHDYLQARCRRLGLAPEALAREVGASVTEVRAWLAGSKLPPHPRLWCLAEVLDTEPADLLWALALEPQPQPAPQVALPPLAPLQPVQDRAAKIARLLQAEEPEEPDDEDEEEDEEPEDGDDVAG